MTDDRKIRKPIVRQLADRRAALGMPQGAVAAEALLAAVAAGSSPDTTPEPKP